MCHVSGGIRRSRFLRSLGGALIAVVAAPGAAAARGRRAPGSLVLSARNVGRRYAGDRSLFATVAPGVAGRDTAAVQFGLDRATTVKLEAVRTALRKSSVVWEAEATLGKGLHELHWTPDPATPVGSYVMRLTLGARATARPSSAAGGRRRSRASRPRSFACSASRQLSSGARIFPARRWSCGSWPMQPR